MSDNNAMVGREAAAMVVISRCHAVADCPMTLGYPVGGDRYVCWLHSLTLPTDVRRLLERARPRLERPVEQHDSGTHQAVRPDRVAQASPPSRTKPYEAGLPPRLPVRQ